MNWLTTIAFAVLLLSVQYDAAESRSPTLSSSPWANPAQASSLMNCLIAKIAGSNVLPQQEKEDLESIMDTLMSAIKGASAKGKTSGAQLQAINMAVASSLAELVVAEDAGNQASIAVKTQALSGALGQCFQAVTGTVDRKFISEINDLISMFAKEAASETNEIQDQGSFYGAGSSGSSSFQATSQSFQGSSQTAGGTSTYPGGAYPGPQVSQPAPIGVGPQVSQPAPIGYTGGASSYGSGAASYGSGTSSYGSRATSSGSGASLYGSGSQFGSISQTSSGQTAGFTSSTDSQGAFGSISSAQSGLISRVANALANTSTMRNVLRSSVTQQTVTTVVQRTIQTLARSLGLDGNNLSRLALQAISQIPQGSDTSAYTQALSTALITSGVLNESNIDTLGSQVLSAVLNGVSSAAQGLGISVDSGSVQNDISSSSSFLSTGSSSASFSQTSGASTTSGFTGGYTGPQISQPAPIGYTGGAAAAGSGTQFGSISQTSSGQTTGFTSSAGSQGAFGQTTQVSQPSGTGPFGGGAGPFGGGAGFGGQTTGANSALISRVASALANSSTLRTLLSSNVSQQTASSLVQRAIQSFSGSLGVDGNSLTRAALQAISQVPAGSDTSAYAQAFSAALVNSGVLNASNINTSGTQVLSAVLNGFSSAGQGLGMNFDSSNVQSDIRSTSSSLSTSSSSASFSQTAGAASTSGFTGGYPGPQLTRPASGFTSSVGSQADFSQASGFSSSVGSQAGFSQASGFSSSGVGQSAGVSLGSTLNSPNGLKSGSAAARISQLTSSLGNAISPSGVDANALASSLQASFSNLQNSGMSSSDAKIEVLLETIVGLLQLLSNTQIRGVNMATASSVANSATRSFELALA